MPRPRKEEHKYLPKRWTIRRGKYYYQVPKGREEQWDGKKLFPLGATKSEAYRTWAERLEVDGELKTVGALVDRYLSEVTVKKPPATQRREAQHAEWVKKAFGQMSLGSIEPHHIYKYYDKRSKKKTAPDGSVRGGATTARHEVAFLSHVYTKAVKWGCLKKHPFKGQVELEGVKSRERYIEDWEILECLSLSSTRKKGSVAAIHAYIRLRLLTGLRKPDILRLREVDIREDGLHIAVSKTKNSIVIEWSEHLRKAVEDARSARPLDIAPTLFCTKRGKGYWDETAGRAEGWDSMWGRFMARALKETQLSERFSQHDLRAKCASDLESTERAKELLDHADARTTEKYYRRKPKRIKPAK